MHRWTVPSSRAVAFRVLVRACVYMCVCDSCVCVAACLWGSWDCVYNRCPTQCVTLVCMAACVCVCLVRAAVRCDSRRVRACVCVCVDGLYLAMCSRAVCILRVCRACECEHVWGRRVTLLCVWKPVCMCLTVFHCDAVYGAACVYVCAPPCDTLFTCVHLCVACSRCCIPCGCVLTQCLRRVRSVCVCGAGV